MKRTIESAMGCVVAIAITNCGTPSDTDPKRGLDLGALESELRAEQTPLNFESAGAWTVTGATAQSSTDRSQGTKSLRLATSGYATITSPLVNSVTNVTSALAVDFRPVANVPWGQVQLFVTIPSQNLTDLWIGQVSVQGLAGGKWHELSFTLPSHVQAALRANSGGVRFKFGFNLPSNTYWIDNGYFLGQNCGTDSAYQVNIPPAPGIARGVRERLECTFYSSYPQMAERFHPFAQQVVDVVFLEQSNYPAYVSDGRIYIHRQFMIDSPQDTDVIVHESMHIIQAGYSGYVPGWIIEGTADYVRNVYGLRNDAAGWSVPSGYSAGQHYLKGYGDAAAFMYWIDATYREGQPPVVDELDDVLRAGTYSNESTWLALTGLTLQELWTAYSGLVPPPPATQGIEVCEDIYFGGTCVMLDRGQYSLVDLLARGVSNDWVSSIRIPPGYAVRAFADDWFSGLETRHDADVPFVGSALNDTYSSLIVE